jgi:hypothetical protein
MVARDAEDFSTPPVDPDTRGADQAGRGLALRRLIKLAIYAFCVVMTGWLVRNEAFPSFFTNASMGYRSLLSREALLFDNWTKITFEGSPIGYSHTQIAVDEGENGEFARLQNSTVLQLKLLGASQRLTTTATVALDEAYRLRQFSFTLSTRQYTARIHGTHRSGTLYDVEIQTGAGKSILEVDIPEDAVIYSPTTELAMRKLRPGQRMRIKTFDPITLRTSMVLCEAVKEEMLFIRGQEVQTTVLTLNYQGITTRAWMDAEGEMVRQENPLGWTIETSNREEALNLNLDTDAMDDMILATAVPVHGNIINGRNCKSLSLRLEGLHLDPHQLVSFRQELGEIDGSTAELVTRKVPLPERATPIGNVPESCREFLVSSPFVQAEHPEMKEMADRIVGDTTDSLEAALKIYEWVDRKVENSVTVSLPSARDVLRQRVGDCNEHTYLFVGLARAAGLPARIRVGLVFNQGALYFHAWPSVYVGEWVEMDPTLSQPTVDATHVALLEGEVAQQLELMKVMGHLSVHVLDEVY